MNLNYRRTCNRFGRNDIYVLTRRVTGKSMVSGDKASEARLCCDIPA